jgi:hypothetical protein
MLSFTDAERLMKVKGVLDPNTGTTKGFETKKDEQEHEISAGSSFLLD